MAVKFVVLFVALAALAQSAPQIPLPYGLQGITHPGFAPGVHYEYDSQYLDPVTGELKGDVTVRRGVGVLDIQADPIKGLDVIAARTAGIVPGVVNPLLGKVTPYGASPYTYPGQFYNYPGLGYKSPIGYPGYF